MANERNIGFDTLNELSSADEIEAYCAEMAPRGFIQLICKA
jgi:hypothetical protein